MAGRALRAENLVVSYGGAPVLDGISVHLAPGEVTVLVGRNGCGKSTLLRACAGLHRPKSGRILVGDDVVGRLSPRALGRRVAFLPQSPLLPSGVSVRQLVEHGRYAHLGPFGRAGREDRDAVAWALAATRTEPLAGRRLDELSGGERQRAWIAMVLAQRAPILLLDEPTTFLDLRYQVEVLDLVRRLADEHGMTCGLVLHDLNQAAAYADKVIALAGGRVVAAGPPVEVVTTSTVLEAFDLDAPVVAHPVTGSPTCLPYARPVATA